MNSSFPLRTLEHYVHRAQLVCLVVDVETSCTTQNPKAFKVHLRLFLENLVDYCGWLHCFSFTMQENISHLSIVI